MGAPFVKMIEILDMLYNKLTIHEKLTALVNGFDALENYQSTFAYFISGVYFILGKPLCTWFIAFVALIITIRITFAIINLVYP